MTMKEAHEAALKGLPVMYDGIEYERITEVGYRINDKLQCFGFVQLMSKNKRSVIYVDPNKCALIN